MLANNRQVVYKTIPFISERERIYGKGKSRAYLNAVYLTFDDKDK